MIISNANLQSLRTAYRHEFNQRLSELDADPIWKKLGTLIKSNSASNTYGFLGAFPHIREWVGERQFGKIKEGAYEIANKLWEATLPVRRTDIEDDNLGLYRAMAREKADEFARFMNRKLAELITGGFEKLCFDGQPFFNASHPVNAKQDGTGDDRDVSNIIGTGAEGGKIWALLNLSSTLKPFIVQERSRPEFDEITDVRNDRVFLFDHWLFGIRYRGSWGYGLWQQAVGSRAELTAKNYEAARLRMQTFTRDGGDPLGIVPTHLVVDPTNEAAARKILCAELVNGGDSNPNFKTAELIVVPHMSEGV